MSEPETVESIDGILIEFDYPPPAVPMQLRPKMPKWTHRLAPMRKFPGRRARILRNLDSAQKAYHQKNNIKRALAKSNPRERWTLNAIKEDDQCWGLWATYEGVMTEAEFLQSELAKEENRDEMVARQLKAKARKAVKTKRLERSAFNPSLRPPTLDPD